MGWRRTRLRTRHRRARTRRSTKRPPSVTPGRLLRSAESRTATGAATATDTASPGSRTASAASAERHARAARGLRGSAARASARRPRRRSAATRKTAAAAATQTAFAPVVSRPQRAAPAAARASLVLSVPCAPRGRASRTTVDRRGHAWRPCVHRAFPSIRHRAARPIRHAGARLYFPIAGGRASKRPVARRGAGRRSGGRGMMVARGQSRKSVAITCAVSG